MKPYQEIALVGYICLVLVTAVYVYTYAPI
jgi:hypothetical protein